MVADQRFIKGKMILLLAIIFIGIPLFTEEYWVSIATMVGYTAMGALGVQLLIGYAGLITLGHAAFIAVGAYTSTLLVLQFPWPELLKTWGLAYPISIVVAGLVGGVWSVLFGLPSAKVKGFYLILTTMAAQFITVDFILTQYVSQIGGRGQAFSLPPGTIKIGPWIIDTEVKIYYLMVVLLVLMIIVLANLLRSRVGRAWVAIRDNDIAAEALGINIVRYKLFAFFVAGFMAGVAGRLLGQQHGGPESRALPMVLVSLAGRGHPHRGRRLHPRGHLRLDFHGGDHGAAPDGGDPSVRVLSEAPYGFCLHQGHGLWSGYLRVPDL